MFVSPSPFNVPFLPSIAPLLTSLSASPVAAKHILVIPKKPMPDVSSDFEDAQVIGHCMVAARKVAEQEGMGESGFRLVVNNGHDALQSVRWLHIHVIGGQKLSWPPGI